MIRNNNDIYTSLSKKYNIRRDNIEEAYNLFWKYIRITIKEMPLKETLTLEDFTKYRSSFNIPKIGKLYSTWNKVEHLNSREINKNGKTGNIKN